MPFGKNSLPATEDTVLVGACDDERGKGLDQGPFP